MGRGNLRFSRLCLVALLLGAISISGQSAYANPRSRELESWRIARDERRFALLNTPALWNLLAIRPGMTILDIGTGTGQFAYAFAQRLQGQGKVYATDINDSCVRYVREQAAQRGLRTVIPAVVNDGLDAFYRSDTYDLVALFHVEMDYERQVDFLRYLRGSLAEDGRLVLLSYKGFPDFSPDDLTDDPEGLAREILKEPPGTPFYRAMRESTRELLRASAGTGSAEGLVQAVAEAFNVILATANFGMDFFDGAAFEKELDFTPEERAYADWLTIPNNRQNASRGVPHATWISGRKVKIINKLLLIQKYRKFLRTGGLYAPGLSTAGKQAFARAGYVVHGESADSIPFEDVVVFTRSH